MYTLLFARMKASCEGYRILDSYHLINELGA